MSNNLFKKLMITHLVIVFISIAVLGIFLAQLLENYFLSQKESELVTKGVELSEITAQYLRKDIDEATTNYLINSLEGFVGARVWVVDKTGLIRMVSRGNACRPHKMMAQAGFKLAPEETMNVLQGEIYKQIGETPHFQEPMVSVGVPIVDEYNKNNNVMGAVFLHAPVTGVTETLYKVYSYLLIATIIAILLALLLAVYLSKTISKPLLEINSAALDMARGNYQTRVRVESKDEIGELAQSFNYMSDKLSQTIDALHQEKSKIESLITSLHEGVIATDREGIVIWVNPMAQNLLPSEDSHVGKSIYDCFLKEIAEVIKETLTTGTTASASLKKDNLTIMAYASPIKDSKDCISGSVCVLQDISESQKLEEMRRNFVSDVSHELRTPLTAIRGYNEALSDGTVEDNETREKYHGIIREETERLERLIHDLLDLSRLQSGKVAIQLEPLDITAIVKATVDKMVPQIQLKGINLETKIPHKVIIIDGNEDRIVQLLIILFDNAIRYTKSGDSILISVENDCDNEEVRLLVSDTGKGIAKEDIPYIWERFYKADKSRTRTGAGTGLGLAIAKQIAELHQGTIRVESELGKGTTFVISFKKSQSSDISN